MRKLVARADHKTLERKSRVQGAPATVENLVLRGPIRRSSILRIGQIVNHPGEPQPEFRNDRIQISVVLGSHPNPRFLVGDGHMQFTVLYMTEFGLANPVLIAVGAYLRLKLCLNQFPGIHPYNHSNTPLAKTFHKLCTTVENGGQFTLWESALEAVTQLSRSVQ